MIKYGNPKSRYEGTNAERLLNFPTVTTQDNGLIFYETDTDTKYEVLEGGWVKIKSGLSPSNTVRVTANYAVIIGDENIFADSDGGVFTVTLPAGVDGRSLRIINTGSSGNNVTIAPNGAELLVGVNASKTISDGTVIILVYETTEGWW